MLLLVHLNSSAQTFSC